MAVQLAALQLEAYYVREMAFRVRPGHEEQIRPEMQLGVGLQHASLFNPDPLTVNVQAGVADHREDPRRWQCVVQIESQNPPERRYPYDFKAALVGFFRVNEQVPIDSIEVMVKINAASILYSAARELLAVLTGRGPLPHVLLPTVVFSPDAEPGQTPATPDIPKGLETTGHNEPAKKGTKKGATKKAKGKKQQR